MTERITPPKYIRLHVFKMSQTAFGALFEKNQRTVSDWEHVGHFPGTLVAKVVKAAKARKITLDPKLFTEVPDLETPAP